MKTDIILAGVGGQGILTIAAAIGMAALQNNLYIKQSEVHGMSQRGGAVESHLRISDYPIASDLIAYGTADIILSVEPMESLRYLPYLSKVGYIISNTAPFQNINDYPKLESILETIKSTGNHILIDANALSKEIKSPRSANIMMLGAASPFICIAFDELKKSLMAIFERKGEEIVNQNVNALQIGRDLALKFLA